MKKRYSKATGRVVLLGLAVVVGMKLWAKNTGAAIQPTTGATTITQGQKPFDEDATLTELRKRIAGQENMPAEKVFKNIQLLNSMPAARLLAVMKNGYSRSLGVTCTHCHVIGEWEKEDKPTKQIARDMALMNRAINNESLKKIKNLKSETPLVNCTTCHRGQIKPALDLP